MRKQKSRHRPMFLIMKTEILTHCPLFYRWIPTCSQNTDKSSNTLQWHNYPGAESLSFGLLFFPISLINSEIKRLQQQKKQTNKTFMSFVFLFTLCMKYYKYSTVIKPLIKARGMCMHWHLFGWM